MVDLVSSISKLYPVASKGRRGPKFIEAAAKLQEWTSAVGV